MRQHALQQGTAIHRTLVGDDHLWGLQEHLLAAVVDATNIGVWQRSGAKKSARPRPVPRPGVRPAGRQVQVTRMPLSAARALFSARNPDAHN